MAATAGSPQKRAPSTDCIQSLQAYYQGFDKHARSNYSDSAGSGCQWHRMGPKFGKILARQPWEKWGIHRLLAM